MRMQSIAIVVLAVATAVPMSAENAFVPAPQWGTSSNTIYTVGSWEFVNGNGNGPQLSAGGDQSTRFPVVSGASYYAPVHLPSGAIVNSIEFEGCDNDASDQVMVSLNECAPSCQAKASISTGIIDTSCNRISAAATPFTVDNLAKTYQVQLSMGNNLLNTINAVRIFYKLQVSPAPATATFSDVPVGTPLHRFVEALAASGITAGCGGGKFCPNDPITRGQMAVFLSAALGLHFPN